MLVLATQEDRELEFIRPAQLFIDCAPKSAVPLDALRAFNPSAGSPTDRVRPLGTGHSTAPFAYECQSFLDNVIAGLGVCSQIGGSTPAAGGGGILPSHGENRGSSPLGSANDFNHLHEVRHGRSGRDHL